MILILAGILAFGPGSVSAQALTKSHLAAFMLEKKANLEAVNPGMSKNMKTLSSVALEDGSKCEYVQSSFQSILKIEGSRMIVFSKESFRPAITPACATAGLQAFEERVLFYESKPSVAEDIEDLEQMSVKSISKVAELVTVIVNGYSAADGTITGEVLTSTYDLSKSSFKNILTSQSATSRTETSDVADIDVTKVDLRDVVFCENNDADNSDCVRGDFSDILF